MSEQLVLGADTMETDGDAVRSLAIAPQQLKSEDMVELRDLAATDLTFYQRGLGDYVRGNRDTRAAMGFLAYWSHQDGQS